MPCRTNQLASLLLPLLLACGGQQLGEPVIPPWEPPPPTDSVDPQDPPAPDPPPWEQQTNRQLERAQQRLRRGDEYYADRDYARAILEYFRAIEQSVLTPYTDLSPRPGFEAIRARALDMGAVCCLLTGNRTRLEQIGPALVPDRLQGMHAIAELRERFQTVPLAEARRVLDGVHQAWRGTAFEELFYLAAGGMLGATLLAAGELAAAAPFLAGCDPERTPARARRVLDVPAGVDAARALLDRGQWGQGLAAFERLMLALERLEAGCPGVTVLKQEGADRVARAADDALARQDRPAYSHATDAWLGFTYRDRLDELALLPPDDLVQRHRYGLQHRPEDDLLAARLWWHLGMAQAATDHPEAAAASFQQAGVLDPDHTLYLATHLHHLLEQGRPAEAVERGQAAAEQHGRTPAVLVLRARALGALQRTDEAITLLRRADDDLPSPWKQAFQREMVALRSQR